MKLRIGVLGVSCVSASLSDLAQDMGTLPDLTTQLEQQNSGCDRLVAKLVTTPFTDTGVTLENAPQIFADVTRNHEELIKVLSDELENDLAWVEQASYNDGSNVKNIKVIFQEKLTALRTGVANTWPTAKQLVSKVDFAQISKIRSPPVKTSFWNPHVDAAYLEQEVQKFHLTLTQFDTKEEHKKFLQIKDNAADAKACEESLTLQNRINYLTILQPFIQMAKKTYTSLEALSTDLNLLQASTDALLTNPLKGEIVNKLVELAWKIEADEQSARFKYWTSVKNGSMVNKHTLTDSLSIEKSLNDQVAQEEAKLETTRRTLLDAVKKEYQTTQAELTKLRDIRYMIKFIRSVNFWNYVENEFTRILNHHVVDKFASAQLKPKGNNENDFPSYIDAYKQAATQGTPLMSEELQNLLFLHTKFTAYTQRDISDAQNDTELGNLQKILEDAKRMDQTLTEIFKDRQANLHGLKASEIKKTQVTGTASSQAAGYVESILNLVMNELKSSYNLESDPKKSKNLNALRQFREETEVIKDVLVDLIDDATTNLNSHKDLVNLHEGFKKKFPNVKWHKSDQDRTMVDVTWKVALKKVTKFLKASEQEFTALNPSQGGLTFNHQLYQEAVVQVRDWINDMKNGNVRDVIAILTQIQSRGIEAAKEKYFVNLLNFVTDTNKKLDADNQLFYYVISQKHLASYHSLNTRLENLEHLQKLEISWRSTNLKEKAFLAQFQIDILEKISFPEDNLTKYAETIRREYVEKTDAITTAPENEIFESLRKGFTEALNLFTADLSKPDKITKLKKTNSLLQTLATESSTLTDAEAIRVREKCVLQVKWAQNKLDERSPIPMKLDKTKLALTLSLNRLRVSEVIKALKEVNYPKNSSQQDDHGIAKTQMLKLIDDIVKSLQIHPLPQLNGDSHVISIKIRGNISARVSIAQNHLNHQEKEKLFSDHSGDILAEIDKLKNSAEDTVKQEGVRLSEIERKVVELERLSWRMHQTEQSIKHEQMKTEAKPELKKIIDLLDPIVEFHEKENWQEFYSKKNELYELLATLEEVFGELPEIKSVLNELHAFDYQFSTSVTSRLTKAREICTSKDYTKVREEVVLLRKQKEKGRQDLDTVLLQCVARKVELYVQKNKREVTGSDIVDDALEIWENEDDQFSQLRLSIKKLFPAECKTIEDLKTQISQIKSARSMPKMSVEKRFAKANEVRGAAPDSPSECQSQRECNLRQQIVVIMSEMEEHVKIFKKAETELANIQISEQLNKALGELTDPDNFAQKQTLLGTFELRKQEATNALKLISSTLSIEQVRANDLTFNKSKVEADAVISALNQLVGLAVEQQKPAIEGLQEKDKKEGNGGNNNGASGSTSTVKKGKGMGAGLIAVIVASAVLVLGGAAAFLYFNQKPRTA